ncbi:MAG: hypothetical protein JJT93_15995 [Gammaproteobacteria bacterium]|nr:hypothetical protein [Gammaproteobacteria bacterium]
MSAIPESIQKAIHAVDVRREQAAERGDSQDFQQGLRLAERGACCVNRAGPVSLRRHLAAQRLQSSGQPASMAVRVCSASRRAAWSVAKRLDIEVELL